MNKYLSNIKIIGLIVVISALTTSAGSAQIRKSSAKKPARTSILISLPSKAKKSPFSPSKFIFVAALGNGTGGGNEVIDDEVSAKWLQGLETTKPNGNTAADEKEAFDLAVKAINAGLEVTDESSAEIFPDAFVYDTSGIRYLRYREAEENMRQALSLVPDDKGYYRNGLGVALYQQLKFQRAEVLFRQAVKLNPTELKFRENMVKSLRGNGKKAEYEAELRELIKLSPSTHKYHYDLANFLSDQTRYTESEKEFRAAIKAMEPDSERASYYYQRLGDTLLAQNKPAEAEAIYREAREKTNDKYKDGVDQLIAVALREQKKYQEAETIFNQLLEKYPDYSKAAMLYELGISFEKQNKIEEAEKAYRQALVFRPNYSEVKERLERLLKNK